MNLPNVVRRSSPAAWVLIALLMPVHAFSDSGLVPHWTVSEFRPNLPQGGRTNTVAVHPEDRTRMFAASDSGGLFKSVDGGFTWTHVDSLPLTFTQAVAYVPASPNIVLVTAKIDYKTNNGGGLWRSEDSGETWLQVALPRPAFPPQPRPLNGFGISAVGDDIVVGTSSGVFVSIDGGVEWTRSDPFPGVDALSVLLEHGEEDEPRRVYAAGPVRVRVGTLVHDQLGSWFNPGEFIEGNSITLHSLERSPLSPHHAFVTNGTRLFRTENRGEQWTAIPVPLQNGNSTCGGTAFVKTAVRNKGVLRVLDLYRGNRCTVHRLRALALGDLPDYSGEWETLAVEHFPRDLALYGAEPVLLASNGGVHNTVDGGATWRYVGGGSGGYNALQVTGVTGQYIGKTSLIDLYFTTHENNIWSVDSSGNVLGREPEMTEGFYIEAERRVKFGGQPRITYIGCNYCRPRWAKRFLQDARDVDHAFGVSPPVLIGKGRRVQDVPHGLDVTSDPDMISWQPFVFVEDLALRLPKLGYAGEDDPTIVYQPYQEGGGPLGLMRFKYSPGLVDLFEPLMSGFGSLALNRTMPSVIYPLYDVTRDTGLHVIAADEHTVMRSTNSGDSWTEIPGLKDLLLDESKLQFQARLVNNGFLMPLVTAISFFPSDPSQVLIGTSEGGIYHSYDRGLTWGRIDGSRGATAVTQFFWASLNTVYVSTFGRGLWRLENLPTSAADVQRSLPWLRRDVAGWHPAPFRSRCSGVRRRAARQANGQRSAPRDLRHARQFGGIHRRSEGSATEHCDHRKRRKGCLRADAEAAERRLDRGRRRVHQRRNTHRHRVQRVGAEPRGVVRGEGQVNFPRCTVLPEAVAIGAGYLVDLPVPSWNDVLQLLREIDALRQAVA